MTPFEETVLHQRLAADPARSAFVMANAGSGKTRVLTDRVARLLLKGVKPEKILCITFTKAAAAEMAERLFNVLGEWALIDDDELTKALRDLEGDDAPMRGPDALSEVRRLFAQALETPGGLKIQTIHSFCEHVLKRFPLEAGAPPGFAIIEDAEAMRLKNEALDGLAMRSAEGHAIGSAIARLSVAFNEKDLRELLISTASRRLGLDAAMARFGGLDGMVSATAAELDVDPLQTPEELKSGYIETIGKTDFDRCYEGLFNSGGNPAKLAPAIALFLESVSVPLRWSALEKIFLTNTGAKRKAMATNATDKIDPWVKIYLVEHQAEFIQVMEKLKALNIFHDTAAYLRLTASLIEEYGKAKSVRAALDFDDLIARTRSLFQHADNGWVMYKLDQGIDHVLIDEAQDTSPAQWAIIEALLKDYLSGAGARDARRSFFAVGDMKQSIYSFQGADAGLFIEKEQDLSKDLARVGDYINEPLTLSFRTVEPVLTFVDKLFADADAAEGLGAFPIPPHGVKREGEGGLVEIWPLTPRPEAPPSNPWDAPVDQPTDAHPVRVLSKQIADTVHGWIGQGVLESQARKILPGDIMILVQTRGPLFDEVIRALAQAGVPVAGADRLKLLEDPAVEDLLSYAKFALLSSDDLSLAEVLKSPLYNFHDDEDLFPLAYNRGEHKSLWAALHQRADENPRWRIAADEMAAARSIGLRQGPFAFLTHILDGGAPSGRRRFYERLTQSSRDAIDELLRQALAYENSNPRSLRAFVDWFEETAGAIKREMERADNAVRVMTVHGAKGLEANIVFLIDGHRGPNLTRLGPVFELERDSANATGRERLSVLVTAAANDVGVSEAARAAKKRKAFEEYRRLLYVAATRARDRLYITGIELGNDKRPREKDASVATWHSLAEDAFDALGDRVAVAGQPLWEGADGCVRRISCPQTAAVEKSDMAEGVIDPQTPPWLFADASPEAPALGLAPSRLADDAEAAASSPAGAPAMSPVLTDRYFRGRTLHRLLELLPGVAPDQRTAAAERLLAKLAPELDATERDAWRDEVLAVLSDPQFADVFGPASRAEVAIAGSPGGAKTGLKISGQIDRLVIGRDKILVVDYKTNRPPPKRVEETSPAYVAQMAAYRALLQEIYSGHQIECALLWTYDARLMALPDAMLDHAFARYISAG